MKYMTILIQTRKRSKIGRDTWTFRLKLKKLENGRILMYILIKTWEYSSNSTRLDKTKKTSLKLGFESITRLNSKYISSFEF